MASGEGWDVRIPLDDGGVWQLHWREQNGAAITLEAFGVTYAVLSVEDFKQRVGWLLAEREKHERAGMADWREE